MIRIWKYKNLEIEMLRENITRKELATQLNISYQSVNNKINHTKPFTCDEMFEVKKILKSNLILDDLFKLEEV